GGAVPWRRVQREQQPPAYLSCPDFYGHHPFLPSFPTRRSSDLPSIDGWQPPARGGRGANPNAPPPGEEDTAGRAGRGRGGKLLRSEEHTSELQSPYDLVCRLLLEKKKHARQARSQQRPGLRRRP